MHGPTHETLHQCPACGGSRLRPWDAEAHLQTCSDCSTVFDNPRLDGPGIEAFYAKFGQYDHWLEDLPGRETVWRRRLEVIGRHAKPGRILDVGAGIGQFLSLARAQGYTVDGVELSPRGCAHAKERFQVDLRQGRLEEHEFPDASFDAITIFHVLEHVPSPMETIATCRRLLAPGGILVVAVPNEIDSLTSRLHRLKVGLGITANPIRGRRGVKSLVNNPSLDEVHLTRFTQRSLRGVLERGGFEVVHLGVDRHLPEVGAKGIGRRLHTRLTEWIHASLGLLLHPTMIACARKRD